MPASVAETRAIDALFDALVRTLPTDRWAGDEVTPGWTLRDHVGHLADWWTRASARSTCYRDAARWLADPEEGIDAWNERHVAGAGPRAPAETLARYDAAHAPRC